MNKIITFLILSLFSFCSLTAQTQLGANIVGENPDDEFGEAVAISGDGLRIAGGSERNDDVTTNAGHVRVYEFNNNNWVQIGDDIDGDELGGLSGTATSLSFDGIRVAIGARGGDNEEGLSSGYVKVYEESGGVWSQVGDNMYGEGDFDNFGEALSMSDDGTRVAIGGRSNDGSGTNAGHVRIYEESGGTWTQIGLDIDGEAANDFFGSAVALSASGTRVIVGAIGNDGNGNFAGHVRIYEESGGVWTQVGSDLDGEAAFDFFGSAVAITSDGMRVAVGGPGNDGMNGGNSGHVRVFDESGGNWVQVGNDIDGDTGNDQFGFQVSLSSDGTTLVASAPSNDGNGNSSGHIRVFEEENGAWIQTGSDIEGEAIQEFAGQSLDVSADGVRLVFGAPLSDDGGVDIGHVRVFEIPEPLPVELIHFSARTKNKSNILQWQVASETNNSHFDIQHSNTGREFKTVGLVKGAGNSSVENAYNYLHEKPNEGSNYYRIKQLDFDGQFEYSDIVKVSRAAQSISFYPNPTTDNIYLSLSKVSQVRIYNTLGSVLDHYEFEAGECEIGLEKYGESMLLIQVEEEWIRVVVE